ncbi:SMI1/KNR4 family protein [Alteromonas confluentis]|uniref:Knr4/Smi1-like domain-containing protein n=1 Tax=Alteromonas confluentis TaxID=1656094 RepID=A0A1E7ZH38_9ALTE|nr:SMI1/KNR4 family protein [Alteromonas confluentis]OFC72774.1 hypothetical protein BFC18_00015 [Alteromonas confluentis]
MEEFKITPPNNKEIAAAQEKLNFKFSQEYILFLKSGYDLGDVPMEALEIVNPPSYANIYTVQQEAKSDENFPEQLLPICEDNGDYYCLTLDGEVIFWSHNGLTDERWKNVTEWREAMQKEHED